jgi:hypothetical protein
MLEEPGGEFPQFQGGVLNLHETSRATTSGS